MAETVLITPRDPLIFRDGRPFDNSLTTRLHVHTWPPPSVTAGALRTHAGKTLGYSDKAALNRIDIRGPLLYGCNGSDEKLYVPAPRDAVLVQNGDEQTLLYLRPEALLSGEGVDLPFSMRPLLSPKTEHKSKNDSKYAWWPLSLVNQWLCDAVKGDADTLKRECLEELPLDERTHVRINSSTGAAEPAELFSTRGIDFMPMPEKEITGYGMPLQLALRVDRADGVHFFGPIPLGAERRMAELTVASENVHKNLWDCPEAIRSALGSSEYIRLQLATPAIFNKGWYPDWLKAASKNSRLMGYIPHSGVEVELIAAAVGRPVPVSGYSYSDGKSQRIKATKKMVPAGSVYFFKVHRGDAASLANLWLHPICGQSYFHPQPDQTRTDLGSDGFGLALWGIWQSQNEEE